MSSGPPPHGSSESPAAAADASSQLLLSPRTGPPLIAVVGTTGAGKSDLAVHLARRLGAGEILNSDTLQVYKDVAIVTNKMPLPDRLGVPHHLMDLRSVADNDPPYSVKEFEHDASQVIARLADQRKPCVLVGGTHYYLQYLLWGDETASSEAVTPDPVPLPSDLHLSSLSPTQLYAHLVQIDPVAAQQWHPNDTRRVKRAIERYYQRGCVPLTPQDSQGDVHPPPPLRYPTLVFWVHTDQPVLDQRLDKRVDDMVHRGLFAELWQLRLTLATLRARQDPSESQADIATDDDTSRGVEQAIGVKEFDDYCALVQSVAAQAGVDIAATLQDVVTDEGNDPDPVVRAIKTTPTTEALQTQLDQIASLRTSAIDAMKLATRRYARRQISWLRARLSPRLARHRDMAHMVVLDTTHVQSVQDFAQSVVDPVVPIAHAFLDAFQQGGGSGESKDDAGQQWKVDPVQLHPRAKDLLRLGNDGGGGEDSGSSVASLHCNVCDRGFRTKQEWQAHQGSRAHRRVIKQKRKEAAKEAGGCRVQEPTAAVAGVDEEELEVDDEVDKNPRPSKQCRF